MAREFVVVKGLALPNCQDSPPCIAKRNLLRLVPNNVAIELVAPELDSCLRHRSFAAAGMAVPETAVDEDHGFVFGKDDIRRPRQVAAVESEAKSETVQQFSNRYFRSGISSANSAH